MTSGKPLEPAVSWRRLNLTRCLDYLEQMVSAVWRTDCSPPSWLCSWRRQPPSYSAMTAQPTAARPRAVVARDPRASGEFIAAAVEAGLSSSGIDVYDAGVLPTPAAAYLVADLDADFGVMISASHNPAPDNGIKFFARGGQKLPDDVEDAIEAQLGKEPSAPGRGRRRTHPALLRRRGPLHRAPARARFRKRLEGLKVVLDCAHGAASGCSPQVFKDAGADVVVIGAEPDGLNINDGVGSTHLGPLKEAVVKHGADLGIAHDGDADRCLAVDHEGNEVDGDQIMAILARGPQGGRKAQGQRPGGHRHEQPRPEDRPPRCRHHHPRNRGG